MVNVRVARPLDAARDVVAITAEGIYEENANRITPHASLFVNKLVTDNFGASFGVNYEKRRVLSAGYLGYAAEQGIEARRNPPLDYNRDGDFNDSYRFIHTTNLVAEGGKFERVTMIGGLQYKPSATLNLYVDGFFSDFKDYSIYNEHPVRFTNIQGPNAGIVASTNGTVLTSLDANGVDHRADTRPSSPIPRRSAPTPASASRSTRVPRPLTTRAETSVRSRRFNFAAAMTRSIRRRSTSWRWAARTGRPASIGTMTAGSMSPTISTSTTRRSC